MMRSRKGLSRQRDWWRGRPIVEAIGRRATCPRRDNGQRDAFHEAGWLPGRFQPGGRPSLPTPTGPARGRMVYATIYESFGTPHEKVTRKTVTLTGSKEMHEISTVFFVIIRS
jgi:hypothetical protein